MRIRIVIATMLAAGLGTGAASAQTGANPVSGAVRHSWEGAKRNIVESAEQAAETLYDFKPSADVRTYGQILAHVAGANYVICSAAKGEKSPQAEDDVEKSAKTKAAIVTALKASLAYCDAAFAALTDASAGQEITMPFGMGKGVRTRALLMNTGHLNEHYGNLVTYMRIKGVVPPSSKRGS
jgi:uncharacterized damage-inducible protein DinB